ncbi:MAG: LD-carboxypeptidase [Chlamydiales bacterium]|nr:LD-carboxypeptidase [Chlamydiales bacterium]
MGFKWGICCYLFTKTVIAMQPEALQVGDTIALVAPAYWSDRIEETKDFLIQRGFRVRLAPNLNLRHGKFAGNDEERAQAFMEMWKDPEVKALWCVRGGYGSGRILDKLDYDYIKAHPKILIGMSDITALHIALGQKSDLTTFLGPVAHWTYDPEKYLQETEQGVWDQILSEGKVGTYHNPINCTTLANGIGEGCLVGGNLALIVAHIGTPYQLETKGKILILEDVSEYPFRVDRMLNQLKQAGMLKDLQGLILASWDECLPDNDLEFSIEEVLHHYFCDAPYPVILGFPSGHIKAQVTLPLNCPYRLDANRQEVTLLKRGVIH